MGKITIRPPRSIIGKRIDAHIGREIDPRPVEADWEIIDGHYYAVRDSRGRVVVVRATDEYIGGRPMFVMAPGEESIGSPGADRLVILVDLGIEAP